jgi:hypothetical protein
LYGTYTNVGSINVVHDIHDPKHGKEVSIDLSDQSLFLGSVGHIWPAIGENGLAIAAACLDLLGFSLVVEFGVRIVAMSELLGHGDGYNAEQELGKNAFPLGGI